MKLRNVVSGFIGSALAFSSSLSAYGAAPRALQRERPPQFILMSFDGSYSVPFWKETRSFAQRHGVRFTYFISGVYFLGSQDETRNLYQGPRQKVGKSDIGFGDGAPSILQRVEAIVDAAREGNEIGSHANGHFNGSQWSFSEWMSELSQFKRFITEVFSIHGFSSSVESDWDENVAKKIRGFRAPLLGVNGELYQALSKSGYTYDASSMDYSGLERGRYNWPYKSRDGRWNFPLQGIKLAGTGKKTVTMDYNILVSQCNNEFKGSGATISCKNIDAERLKAYEDEMVETYISLFKKSYFGNRAPINIGHHFSLWNKGAYWKALQRFAADVCNLEEVRCITYGDMIQWLEQENLSQIMAYQNAQFQRLPVADLGLFGEDRRNLDISADVQMREQGDIVASVHGRDLQKLRQDGVTYQWKVDGEVVAQSEGAPRSLKLSPEQAREGKTVTLSIQSQNKEILGATRTVRQNSKDWVWLQNTGWEQRVLRGDLPEAHSETEDTNLIEQMRVR
jgi:peptidoglycan/xylan/chitin deacetylase (PgdA/CDA1 family)